VNFTAERREGAYDARDKRRATSPHASVNPSNTRRWTRAASCSSLRSDRTNERTNGRSREGGRGETQVSGT
jgi:hypothetical protein